MESTLRRLFSKSLNAVLPRSFMDRIRTIREEEQPFGRHLWTLFASTKTRSSLTEGLRYTNVEYPFATIERRPSVSNAARELTDLWVTQQERESLTVFRGTAFIEPRHGWVVCSPAHLVDNCLIDSRFAPKPLFMDYVRARWARGKRIRRERAVLHLRSWGEANYWHFLNDLIGGRLRLAELCGIPEDIPILIGVRAVERDFVRELLATTALASRRWIVQEADEYVEAEEVVLFETARTSKANLQYVLNLLRSHGGDRTRNRRIFLAREASSGRSILNMGELRALCREFEFEIVTTERMSIREQMTLFSETRHAIAIHGAGLTNLIFRNGAPLTLGEIFPPVAWGGMPPLFCWLAQTFNFEYNAILGTGPTKGDYRSAFYLDAQVLREYFARLGD